MFTNVKHPDVRIVLDGSAVVAVVFLWHFRGDLRILYPSIKGKAHQAAFSSSPTVISTDERSMNAHEWKP